MINIHFDFETFSESPLKDVGGWVYSQHPSTEVICMAYAYEDADPILWLPDENLPEFMMPDTHGQYHLHAWHSGFEYAIMKNTMKLKTPPLSCWTDSAALATVMAWPSALAKCGAAMGIPESMAKNKRGYLLIQRLSVLYRGERNRDPEMLQEFYEYCKQDVVAERYIEKKLLPLNPFERKLWELDQEINFRGIEIDMENVENAIAINEKKCLALTEELQGITGCDNPNSWQQFLPWAQSQGFTGDNMQKETIETFLEELKK